MKKLFIFDLDGTLANSLEDLADSSNYALSVKKYPVHPVDEYRYFVGNGVKKLCERVLPTDKRTEDEIESLNEIFASRYNSNYLTKTRPYKNIVPMLKSLKSKGVMLAVASNKPHEFTEKIISELFEKNIFDFIKGNSPPMPTKPSPDIVLFIMDRLGIKPEDAVFVGDTGVDILTAKNAGITSIGCLWGFRTRDELESACADYIVSDPLEISALLKNI